MQAKGGERTFMKQMTRSQIQMDDNNYECVI